MKTSSLILVAMLTCTTLTLAVPLSTAGDCAFDNYACVCIRGSGGEDCYNSRGQSCAVVVTPVGEAASYGVDCEGP